MVWPRYQHAEGAANAREISTQRGRNIVLIGMPGSGKTTVGQLLAERLGRAFWDTDLLLERRFGKRAKELLAEHGAVGFRALEESVVLSLRCREAIIATGGSVIYSERGMRHLRHIGWLVYLHVDLAVLAPRLKDLDARGVVRKPGQSLASLYAEREPLYRRNAHVIVDTTELTPEAVATRIVELSP
jgi:shikimate kinase